MAGGFQNDPTNPYVEWYKNWARAQGYELAGKSNKDITKFLGDSLRNKGQSIQEMGATQGNDFKNAYLDIINEADRSMLGEVGAGFRRGGSGLMSTMYGGVGLGAEILGLPTAGEALLDKASEWRKIAAEGAPPSIERATDVRWDRPSEAARFLFGAFGEAAPSVMEAIGSFYAGGGIGSQLAKQGIRKRIRETMSKSIKHRGADKSAREGAEELLAKVYGLEHAAARGFQTGSLAGIATSSLGLGVGEIYSELHPFTQLDPSDKDYVSPEDARSISMQYGLMAGSLDLISAATILNKVLRIGDKPAKTYLRRLIQNLPSGLIIEGATEAAQEFLNIAAQKYAHNKSIEFTQDEINRMIDAGVLGMVGGGQFSMITSFKGPPSEADEADDAAPTPEATLKSRQDALLEYLKEDDASAKELGLKVGDEVHQFMGISGKISRFESASDGEWVYVETMEKGKPTQKRVRLSSLSKTPAIKDMDTDKLEKVVADAKEDMDSGESTATDASTKATSELNEREDEEDVPDTEEGDTDVEIDGIKLPYQVSKQKAADIAEIFNDLKQLSESDQGFQKGDSHAMKPDGPMEHYVTQVLGKDFAEWKKKYKSVKSALKQMGFLSSKPGEINVWQHTETVKDKAFREARELSETNKRKGTLEGKGITDTDGNVTFTGKVKRRGIDEEQEIERIEADGRVKLRGIDGLIEPSQIFTVKKKGKKGDRVQGEEHESAENVIWNDGSGKGNLAKKGWVPAPGYIWSDRSKMEVQEIKDGMPHPKHKNVVLTGEMGTHGPKFRPAKKTDGYDHDYTWVDPEDNDSVAVVPKEEKPDDEVEDDEVAEVAEVWELDKKWYRGVQSGEQTIQARMETEEGPIFRRFTAFKEKSKWAIREERVEVRDGKRFTIVGKFDDVEGGPFKNLKEAYAHLKEVLEEETKETVPEEDEREVSADRVITLDNGYATTEIALTNYTEEDYKKIDALVDEINKELTLAQNFSGDERENHRYRAWVAQAELYHLLANSRMGPSAEVFVRIADFYIQPEKAGTTTVVKAEDLNPGGADAYARAIERGWNGKVTATQRAVLKSESVIFIPQGRGEVLRGKPVSGAKMRSMEILNQLGLVRIEYNATDLAYVLDTNEGRSLGIHGGAREFAGNFNWESDIQWSERPQGFNHWADILKKTEVAREEWRDTPSTQGAPQLVVEIYDELTSLIAEAETEQVEKDVKDEDATEEDEVEDEGKSEVDKQSEQEEENQKKEDESEQEDEVAEESETGVIKERVIRVEKGNYEKGYKLEFDFPKGLSMELTEAGWLAMGISIHEKFTGELGQVRDTVERLSKPVTEEALDEQDLMEARDRLEHDPEAPRSTIEERVADALNQYNRPGSHEHLVRSQALETAKERLAELEGVSEIIDEVQAPSAPVEVVTDKEPAPTVEAPTTAPRRKPKKTDIIVKEVTTLTVDIKPLSKKSKGVWTVSIGDTPGTSKHKFKSYAEAKEWVRSIIRGSETFEQAIERYDLAIKNRDERLDKAAKKLKKERKKKKYEEEEELDEEARHNRIGTSAPIDAHTAELLLPQTQAESPKKKRHKLIKIIRSIAQHGSPSGRAVARLLLRGDHRNLRDVTIYRSQMHVNRSKKKGEFQFKGQGEPGADRSRYHIIYGGNITLWSGTGTATGPQIQSAGESTILHEALHAVYAREFLRDIYKLVGFTDPTRAELAGEFDKDSTVRQDAIRDGNLLYNYLNHNAHDKKHLPRMRQLVDRLRNEDTPFGRLVDSWLIARDAWNNNPEARSSEVGAYIKYGLSSFQEFMSELFSNQDLQGFLHEVEYVDNRSILQTIIDALAEFFGWDINGASLLERAWRDASLLLSGDVDVKLMNLSQGKIEDTTGRPIYAALEILDTRELSDYGIAGNILKKGMTHHKGGKNGTRVLVVLEKSTDLGDPLPAKSIRVMTAHQGTHGGQTGVVKVSDMMINPGKSTVHPIKAREIGEGDTQMTMNDYTLIGKMEGMKPVGEVDAYFDNMKELEKYLADMERQNTGDKNESAAFSEAIYHQGEINEFEKLSKLTPDRFWSPNTAKDREALLLQGEAFWEQSKIFGKKSKLTELQKEELKEHRRELDMVSAVWNATFKVPLHQIPVNIQHEKGKHLIAKQTKEDALESGFETYMLFTAMEVIHIIETAKAEAQEMSESERKAVWGEWQYAHVSFQREREGTAGGIKAGEYHVKPSKEEQRRRESTSDLGGMIPAELSGMFTRWVRAVHGAMYEGARRSGDERAFQGHVSHQKILENMTEQMFGDKRADQLGEFNKRSLHQIFAHADSAAYLIAALDEDKRTKLLNFLELSRDVDALESFAEENTYYPEVRKRVAKALKMDESSSIQEIVDAYNLAVDGLMLSVYHDFVAKHKYFAPYETEVQEGGKKKKVQLETLADKPGQPGAVKSKIKSVKEQLHINFRQLGQTLDLSKLADTREAEQRTVEEKKTEVEKRIRERLEVHNTTHTKDVSLEFLQDIRWVMEKIGFSSVEISEFWQAFTNLTEEVDAEGELAHTLESVFEDISFTGENPRYMFPWEASEAKEDWRIGEVMELQGEFIDRVLDLAGSHLSGYEGTAKLKEISENLKSVYGGTPQGMAILVQHIANLTFGMPLKWIHRSPLEVLASELMDGKVEMNISANLPSRLISPVTGKEVVLPALVTDEESATIADHRARHRDTMDMMPEEHPLEQQGEEQLLADSRMAMQRFIDGGQPAEPFSAAAALKRILEVIDHTFDNGEALSFWARAITGNAFLDSVRVRFVPWSEFRKYVSTSENQFSPGVYLHDTRQVLINDTFWDGTGSADEALVSQLLHELLHAPIQAGLDVGYAVTTGHEELMDALKDAGLTWQDESGLREGTQLGMSAKELAKTYNDVTEVLLPFLQNNATLTEQLDHLKAFGSADEFFVTLATSSSFRELVSSLEFDSDTRRKLGVEKSRIRTVWDWVVNLLSRLWGIKRSPEVLEYAEKALSAMVGQINKMGSVGKTIHAVNARGITELYGAPIDPLKLRHWNVPEDSARVFHEASAGGLNFLIETLTRVHARLMKDGVLKEVELVDFIDTYGKLALGYGRKNVSAVAEKLQRLLSPWEVDASTVRIGDAGRNARARDWGTRYAVAYLEKTLFNANKQVVNLTDLISRAEDEVAKGERLFDSVKEGKLKSPDELAAILVESMQKMTVERLETISKALADDAFSGMELKFLQKIKVEQVKEAMLAMLDITGEFETATMQEINDHIEASTDKRFDFLRKGKPLDTAFMRAVFVVATKNSADAYSMLRLSTNKVEATQADFLLAIKQLSEAKTYDEVYAINKTFGGRLGRQFGRLILAKNQEIMAMKSVPANKQLKKVYKEVDKVLTMYSEKLRVSMMEMEPVDIRAGVVLMTAEKVKGKDGKTVYDDEGQVEWEINRDFKVEFDSKGLKDKKEFNRRNKQTLEFLNDPKIKKKYSSEPWYDILSMQAQKALLVPATDEWFASRRAAWMAGMESANQRFARMGYHGTRLAGMTAQTVATYRDLLTHSLSRAKKFNYSYHKFLDASGLDGQEFYIGLYQDIFYWLDNKPEYAGKETEAFNALWEHVKDVAPSKAMLTQQTRAALKDLLNKTIDARDWEAKVNRDLGNRVRDDEVKVKSFINGEMVDFYRAPLEMGYTTLPRALFDEKLLTVVDLMTSAGWARRAKDMPLIAESAKLANAEDTAGILEIYDTLFNEEIILEFVTPYLGSDVRKSNWYGPADKEEGWGVELSNVSVAEIWRLSDGKMNVFLDHMFDEFAPHDNQDDAGRAQWYHSFLKQLHKKYKDIAKVSESINSSATSAGLFAREGLRNTPRSLDARQLESRLPKDFFMYDMYDEVSMNIRLAMFVTTATFGRDGINANMAYKAGREGLKISASLFNTIMAEATGTAHRKPLGAVRGKHAYTKVERQTARSILLRKNPKLKNVEQAWDDLYAEAIAEGELKVVMDHLNVYYGQDNIAGPYKDANWIMEILGTAALQVLNNPKSSFWQMMSMMEFPMAFRGLNAMSIKGTTKAMGNFINQTFGGMLEAMGMQLERVNNYADNLSNTHFRMEEAKLPYAQYQSQVGNAGVLTDKSNPKRIVRWVKNITMHHRKRGEGKRAPVDPLSLITGIFPYINNNVNHSVGVAANFVYQDLVLQAAKYIREHDIQEIREIAPEELGLGKRTFEWIIGEVDGWNNANKMLLEAGAPTISRLAFDYVDRKKTNPKAEVLPHNTQLLINQVGMNNLSGEGFNAKPAWLYAPGWRYFSFFLGWPISKMSRDNRFMFRDHRSSVATWMAMAKYLGLMTAVYAPIGLSFAFLIDWYDDEVLDKPNNLPPVTPWAALPILGIPLAMRDENFTWYSITSRLARAGTPYGIGFELANGFMASGDPYGASREISLDSRLFAVNMFKNIYNAFGTWVHQGEYDWQTVGRKLTYGMGGNSVIQMMDLVTNIMDLDTEERRVADYIGTRNWIKKTAWMMGIHLRPPMKGTYGLPTALSLNVRQMERAAYANDTVGFLVEYKEAVRAAREHLDHIGKPSASAEELVADRFKGRQLRTGISLNKIGDMEWEVLLSLLPPDVRARIEQYEKAHLDYVHMIGGSFGRKSQMLSPEEMRRIAVTGQYHSLAPWVTQDPFKRLRSSSLKPPALHNAP